MTKYQRDEVDELTIRRLLTSELALTNALDEMRMMYDAELCEAVQKCRQSIVDVMKVVHFGGARKAIVEA